MRQFCIALAAFVLLSMMVSFCTGWAYEQIVMKQSKIYRQDKSFWQVAATVDTLFLGDSHVGTGIDPKSFPRSFNLAFDGENYVGTYLKLSRILGDSGSEPPKIQTVICGFDPNLFSSYKAGVPSKNFLVWREYFTVSGVFARHGLTESLEYSALSRLVPHFSEMENTERFLRKSWSRREAGPPMSSGYVARSAHFSRKSQRQREGVGQRRAASHFADQQLYDPLIVSYFWKIVDLCESEKIKLILVMMPCSKEYVEPAVEDFGVDLEHRRLRPGFESRSQVRVLRYTKQFFDDIEFFADSDHLNAQGAEVFSRMLSVRVSEMVASTGAL